MSTVTAGLLTPEQRQMYLPKEVPATLQIYLDGTNVPQRHSFIRTKAMPRPSHSRKPGGPEVLDYVEAEARQPGG